MSILDADGYKVVYLDLGTDLEAKLPTNPEWFTNFINQCGAHGAEVHAMMACTSGISDSVFNSKLQKVIDYNAAHPGYEFSGIHVDAEPAAGSTLAQHNTYCGQIASLLAAMKLVTGVSYPVQTIVTQGLTLSFDVDPRWGSTACEANFILCLDEVDYFDAMLYANSVAKVYASGTNYNGGGQGVITIAVAQRKPFRVAQETDEMGSAYGDSPVSWYANGKSAFYAAMATMDAYYVAACPTLFIGMSYHHYSFSISHWHVIADYTCQLAAGDVADIPDEAEVANFTVTLRTSDNGYYRPYGIKLVIKNPAGVVVSTQTAIKVMAAMDTKVVSFNYTFPVGASGDYSAELSVWDLDWNNNGRYSMLYYADASGYGLGMTSDVENYDMDTLAALANYNVPGYGARPATKGRRDPYLELDSTGFLKLRPSPAADINGDVNKDGKINTADITEIERIIVGL